MADAGKFSTAQQNKELLRKVEALTLEKADLAA